MINPGAFLGLDVTMPHHARVYDYVLGGKDNYAADREAADKLLAVAPDARRHARNQRAFLVNTVSYIAERGVRQFLDLGCGIPTSPNVHEVARGHHPTARVMYVDVDPIVVVHAQALLAIDDGIVAVHGDIRDPDSILDDAEVRQLLDFDQPLGLLVVNVLHGITDDHNPASIIARFRDQLASGSYLALAQFSTGTDPNVRAQHEAIYAETPWPITYRTRHQIQRLFDGFHLELPGLADIERWHPIEDQPPTSLRAVGGVGRKP